MVVCVTRWPNILIWSSTECSVVGYFNVICRTLSVLAVTSSALSYATSIHSHFSLLIVIELHVFVCFFFLRSTVLYKHLSCASLKPDSTSVLICLTLHHYMYRYWFIIQLRLKIGTQLQVGKRWAKWSIFFLTRTGKWNMNSHSWRCDSPCHAIPRTK